MISISVEREARTASAPAPERAARRVPIGTRRGAGPLANEVTREWSASAVLEYADWEPGAG